MKILQINSYNFGSTGNIMVGIAETARVWGMECITACPDGRSMRRRQLEDHLFIGNPVGRNLHIKLAELTGLNGCFSVVDTWLFLRKIRKIQPDVIHLHNLHNCYINLPMLFRFLRRSGIPVVWTLHDCWAFTGKCPYFDMVGCDRWKTGCHHCPQLAEYPTSRADTTAQLWKWKRSWFTLPEKMTIVTPSKWLGELASQSFLGKYPVKVIPNGTDLSVFQPDMEEKAPAGKYTVLGVAFDWGRRKGLDVFLELARRLDERFQIVLVGTNEEIDRQLPQNILSIHRTADAGELAQIYRAADVFANPTREEALGMVNIEALACGTPVVTFRTGGSPECLDDTCGVVVEKDDIDAMAQQIIRVCTEKPYAREDCVRAARRFDKQTRFADYCRLYEEQYV